MLPSLCLSGIFKLEWEQYNSRSYEAKEKIAKILNWNKIQKSVSYDWQQIFW